MSGEELDAAVEEVTALLKSRGIAFVGGFARIADDAERQQGKEYPPLHVRVRACAPDHVDFEGGRAMVVHCLNGIIHQAKSIAGVETVGDVTTLN